MRGSSMSASAPSPARRWRLDDRTTAVVLMLPPALLLFTLFVILPLLDAGYYSLFKWNGYGAPSEFVGLDNYAQVLSHGIFWQSVRNSVIVLVVSIVVQMPLALLLALLVYRQTPTNAAFRLVFFLPYILAEIASGLIWSFVFDGNTGVAAGMFAALGMKPFFILADKDWAFFAITVVVVWKYFGFHMMIYIAALQGVPTEMIEACKIEGAGRWQIVRHILIPQIKPALMVSGFFAVVGSLQLFDVVIPLTNGGPSNSTHTIVTYLYAFGLTRLKVGFGSAVGVILFLAAIVVAVAYQRTLNKGAAR
ncbi:sugar ABC transporter permease [Rhizobium leguminosarum]|nr:sugar ABC transporter permease [Rhizobium leguminosarum]TAX11245.1 sugar ABC transporter permease [Rhizobium leguminosarum]TAY14189.1 sugar ABC transporter permease [Rhizobium leguminosarum]TAZ15913.1 sugar ABC transporter permease [Rhizobium leguminosarum]